MNFRYLLSILINLCVSWSLSAQLAVTMTGDFEKKSGMVVSWSENEAINEVNSLLVSEVQQVVDSVWILYHCHSPATDTTMIKQFILDNGGSMENVAFLPVCSNANWIGSATPGLGFAAFAENLERFFYGGIPYSENDSLAYELAQYFLFPISAIPLYIDGRNVLHDGLRNGFSTRDMITENQGYTGNEVGALLSASFNLNNWVFLESMKNSGGGSRAKIEDFMQIVDFETILVTSYPDTLPDFSIFEENLALLQGMLNPFGQPYHIYKIPAAPLDDGIYPTNPNGELRSYANSLIVNNLVFVPQYNMPWYDSTALYLYQMAMPGFKIIPVNARILSQQHGSLQSLVIQIPQNNYLRIEHEKIVGLHPYQSDIQVTCISKSGELVEEMWLYYKKQGDTTYMQTPVYLVCPEHFGKIENLTITDTVSYYLEAISTTETTKYPISAPEGNFTFWFDPLLNVTDNNSEWINVYPNPGNGILHFTLNKNLPEIEVSIFDLMGKRLIKARLKQDELLDCSHMLSSGLYLISISTDKETESIWYHVR